MFEVSRRSEFMERARARAGGLLTIDLAAIRHNYKLCRKQLTTASCGAVLKADAYGLGAARVAPVLAEEGCRHLFVAHIDEGIALRNILAGSRGVQIFVLHGSPPGAEEDLLASALIPVLNSSQQIDAWRALSRKLD
jgi:alanine racemase